MKLISPFRYATAPQFGCQRVWFLCWAFVVACAIAGCNPSAGPETTSSAESSPSSPALSSAAAGQSLPQRSQADLAAAFEGSQAEIFDGRTPENLAKIKPFQMVTVTSGTDGLVVQSSGNDPALFIPEMSRKDPCLIKIEITSPANTLIQLFYLTGTQKVYTEPGSVVQKLKAGRNVVYFELNSPNLSSQWRLDPGDFPGTYIIHNFEVRAITAK